MSNPEHGGPSDTARGESCPHCGAPLLHGTVDFADTPDETRDADLGRVELRPGQMVESDTCPTPGCPGPDSGARL